MEAHPSGKCLSSMRNPSTNKELPKAVKAKGVHHHQTNIIRNIKGPSLRKRRGRKNIDMNVKMATTMYLSVITLNVNGLNAPVKRQRAAEWIRKQRPL